MKTALVLSGGGAKGAFQAGALQILHQNNFNYQSVAGVSVGALNGVLIAAEQIHRLIDIWHTITEDQIYKKRSIRRLFLQYLSYKIGISEPPRSLYSNEPLFNLLKEVVHNIQLKKPLTIGRVNLRTGNYISAIDPDSSNFPAQVLASTAIPVVWEPVSINGEMFVDGGVRNMTPLKDVIEHDPDRIIIITTEPFDFFEKVEEVSDIFNIAQRTLDILLNEIFREDIDRCIQINNLVKQAEEQGFTLKSNSGRTLKYYELIIITPPEEIGSSLDFDRERLDRLFKMGMEAAQKAIDSEK